MFGLVVDGDVEGVLGDKDGAVDVGVTVLDVAVVPAGILVTVIGVAGEEAVVPTEGVTVAAEGDVVVVETGESALGVVEGGVIYGKVKMGIVDLVDAVVSVGKDGAGEAVVDAVMVGFVRGTNVDVDLVVVVDVPAVDLGVINGNVKIRRVD